MKFSILVPVYNVEKYLEQCVESLLDQTYTGEYEIILVDDGSTDSSGAICDKYAQAHSEKVRVVHKKNEGLVSARQAAIPLAIGEYSLFVDSDDFVDSKLLKTLSEYINRNDNPDMVIYSFRYYSNGKSIERKKTAFDCTTIYTENNKKELYDLLISTPYITSLVTKVIKTDILRNDPTDYSLYFDKNMAEDWFRSIHLLTAAKKIVCTDAPLYYYRTNEESISRSFRPETIEKKNILYVYDRFLEYLPLWGMDTEESRQKLDARWLGEVVYTFRQYYENASRKDKKAVLAFDWSSMLPESVRNGTHNPFENKTVRRIYTLVSKKNSFGLNLYFTYNRFIKNLCKLKSRLLKK